MALEEIVTDQTTEKSVEAEKPAAADGRGADGKFAPKADGKEAAVSDWRAGIEDPELQELAKRIASPADAIKSIAELRKANGSMVKMPAKDAKPEDIAKFRKALGVPEKVDDYKFDVEGHEASDADMAIRAEVAKVLHAENVPASVAPKLAKVVSDIGASILAEQDRVAFEARGASEAGLKKDWGADFEANKNMAINVANQLGTPALKGFLNEVHNGQKIGDHPELIRILGTVGRRMGEGQFIGATGKAEVSTLKGELEQLYRDNPVGTDKFSRPDVQARMREINEQLFGTTPIVGQGRAV